MVRVLFVCLGNICRSPTADGVFRKLVADEGLSGRIESDSAGIIDCLPGAPPDLRAREAARRRGIDLSSMRARPVSPVDLAEFDLLLAMDRPVRRWLAAFGRRLGAQLGEDRLRLFLDYAPGAGRTEVPDPYFGGMRGFERVLDLAEEAARGLLDDIRRSRLG